MIRNPIPWPNGAKCAVAITFDMDADSLIHLDHPADGYKRASAISMLQYGPEIAIPRIVETYRRLGINQTFFIPSWCMERYPGAVEAILKGGHEIGQHGHLHENPVPQSREEQAAWMDRSIEVIDRMTGSKPRGWRAPLYNFSNESAELLVERGFKYDASLMADDVPYVIEAAHGSLIELPSHWGLDDWPQYVQSMDLDYMMPIRSPEAGWAPFVQEFEAAYRQLFGRIIEGLEIEVTNWTVSVASPKPERAAVARRDEGVALSGKARDFYDAALRQDVAATEVARADLTPGDRQATRRRNRWSGPVLIHHGSLGPWHGMSGVGPLLDALPEARLAVVGDGPSPEHPRIEAFPAADPGALADLLSAADVGLVPTPPDAPAWLDPLKVWDFRAVGLPSVGSAHPATHGCDRRVPSGDVDAWVDAVRTLLGAPRTPRPRPWKQVCREALRGITAR